jgi:hypothetical protein
MAFTGARSAPFIQPVLGVLFGASHQPQRSSGAGLKAAGHWSPALQATRDARPRPLLAQNAA